MPRDDPETDPMAINPDRLDTEWLLQAQLTRRCGYAEADARHDHAQAKSSLDVVEARLRLMISRNPTAYNLKEKPTVGDVNAAVLLQPEYAKAEDALHVAKHTLDIRTADTTACLDRRKALERLVELLSLDYYAERGEPAPKTEAARQTRDAISDRATRATFPGIKADD